MSLSHPPASSLRPWLVSAAAWQTPVIDGHLPDLRSVHDSRQAYGHKNPMQFFVRFCAEFVLFMLVSATLQCTATVLPFCNASSIHTTCTAHENLIRLLSTVQRLE